MLSRATLFSSPGGDTVQMEATCEYLKKLGVEVDIKLSTDKISYDDYDLIHFFNIFRPADLLSHIKQTDRKLLISTIYVDYNETEKKSNGIRGLLSKLLNKFQMEYIKTLARMIFSKEKIISKEYILLGQKRSIKKAAQRASMLLPNSKSEYNRLAHDLKIKKDYTVIPNSADIEIFNHKQTEENTDYKDAILCAGRIEPRKNQLNLIKALKNTKYKLVIIGKASPNHQKYYNLCLEEAGDNVEFIHHIKQGKLAQIYKAAKVHVLPSWFETTGLSTLEAAFMKCNVVISNKGDTEEYFKDFAYYCNPDDIKSIKSSIDQAYLNPYQEEFYAYLLNNYTWEHTASKTLEAYRKVLK
jgi:glycosyltransferase involved in cell wall biosynthesis